MRRLRALVWALTHLDALWIEWREVRRLKQEALEWDRVHIAALLAELPIASEFATPIPGFHPNQRHIPVTDEQWAELLREEYGKIPGYRRRRRRLHGDDWSHHWTPRDDALDHPDWDGR